MSTPELKKKLDAALEHLQNELSQIRTGRVTPSLLDSVAIDAYGSKLTVKEVGTVHILDSQTLQISPWDKSLLETIAGSIRNSDLHLNPSVSNNTVLVPVPPLTEERRKELSKLVSAKVEEAKSSMRYIRQEAMKDVETRFNNKEFGEDEKFALKEEVEEIVKGYVLDAEALGNSKKDDIMSLGN